MTVPNYKGKTVQLPCQSCQKFWAATVGKRGWNRCHNCGATHFACDLLVWLDRHSTEVAK